MPEALYPIVVLACPLGMGLMMWFMMRGGKRSAPKAPDDESAQPSASAVEVAALRAEVDRLRAEHRDGPRHTGGMPPGGASTTPR